MFPINRNTVHLEIDKNTWEDIVKKSGVFETSDKTNIIIKILKQNQRNHKTIVKLQRHLEESNILNKKLKAENDQLQDELKDIENDQQKMIENEIMYNDIKKRNHKLEADYNNLKLKFEKLKNNPVIKEKIVYKTDENLIHELHEKYEKLRGKYWEKISEIEVLNKELKELKMKLDSVENWKLKNYGMILKVIPKEHELIDFDLEPEFINLSEYNMWLRNKREFLNNKNLDNHVHVINICKNLL